MKIIFLSISTQICEIIHMIYRHGETVTPTIIIEEQDQVT
jgi:hypothetical protein